MNNKTYESGEYSHIMDLPGDMRALCLIDNDTIKQTANILQISTKRWRNPDVVNQSKFYSLCSHDNRPQVMIWVMNNAVHMCRAINYARPTQYMPQVVNFIVSNQFDIAGDMACTGIIRQKDNYYNVYDLPQNFVYNGDMDLSFAGLYDLPNMSTVTIFGNYNIKGNRIHCFDGAPREVLGNFDVSKNWYPQIIRCKLRTLIHGEYINDFNAKQYKCH